MFDTEKSTGSYLSEAYEASAKEIEAHAKLMETPADLAEKEKAKAIFKDADDLLKLNILNDTFVKGYIELGKALAERKGRLEKLYGIKINEYSLKALSDACEKFNMCCENELREKEESFQTMLTRLSEEAEAEEAAISAEAAAYSEKVTEEIQVLRKEFDRNLKRDKAEYEYNLKRERKIASEKREAELTERENALTRREEEAEEKKRGCLERLEEIGRLEREVLGIEEQLEKAEKEGAKEMEQELSRVHAFKEELDQKTREHTITAYRMEYDHLAEKYKALEQEVSELSKKLDQCNTESRKLTSDTVRFIGGINILNAEKAGGDAAVKK